MRHLSRRLLVHNLSNRPRVFLRGLKSQFSRCFLEVLQPRTNLETTQNELRIDLGKPRTNPETQLLAVSCTSRMEGRSARPRPFQLSSDLLLSFSTIQFHAAIIPQIAIHVNICLDMMPHVDATPYAERLCVDGVAHAKSPAARGRHFCPCRNSLWHKRL
jgi:hypothetical protein